MSVTEQERKTLYDWFEEHMGAERASAMMRMLPPAGWADVATRRDLDALEERLDNRIQRFAERLDARVDLLDAKIDGACHELRADLQRTFVTWMFAAQGAVVAAIGLLFALLR